MKFSMSEVAERFTFHNEIDQICAMPWHRLSEGELVDAAWAYYYFSIQFRENLEIAAARHPHDRKLRQLVKEECNTANLSPFPGVAAAGEAMNHDEFMKRALALAPIASDKRARFEKLGQTYLAAIRAMDDETRAISISSYEDGGLESVFRAILTATHWNHPVLAAFKHFLVEHIRFDSDPDAGHGALSRHLPPDDRVQPIWARFRSIFVDFAPALGSAA